MKVILYPEGTATSDVARVGVVVDRVFNINELENFLDALHAARIWLIEQESKAKKKGA